jgi:hypothetical protein
MHINKKFFPQVLPDNEIAYFAHLEGIIASVDELSTLEITKNPNAYHFRLAPSLPKYNEMLLHLSKSIKSSATIVFEINLEDK